jgi:hypothetical protein
MNRSFAVSISPVCHMRIWLFTKKKFDEIGWMNATHPREPPAAADDDELAA